MAKKTKAQGQRGAALVEFALVGTVFLTAMFAVIEFGRLFWVHNSVKAAAQRGARYATLRKNDSAGVTAVKNMVIYGDPNANPATAKPLVPGLKASNVSVSYKNYNGLQLSAQATVSITNYKFNFAIPIVGTTITLPAYSTTLPGESAGYIPCNYPSGTPAAPCNIVPN